MHTADLIDDFLLDMESFYYNESPLEMGNNESSTDPQGVRIMLWVLWLCNAALDLYFRVHFVFNPYRRPGLDLGLLGWYFY